MIVSNVKLECFSVIKTQNFIYFYIYTNTHCHIVVLNVVFLNYLSPHSVAIKLHRLLIFKAFVVLISLIVSIFANVCTQTSLAGIIVSSH